MVPQRSETVRQMARLLLTVGLVAGLGLVMLGILRMFGSSEDALPALAVGALLVVLSCASYLLVGLLQRVEISTRRMDLAVEEIKRLVATLRGPIESLASDAQISDGSKSVIHRNKECEALRNALRSHIVKGEWESAYFVIDQMEKRVGMHEEAARFLKELEQARRDAIEVKLDEALAHVGASLEARDWVRAEDEVSRLQRLFPDNEQVQGLTQKLAASRTAHKQELLAEWDAAVKRSDVDRGIEILRDLDAYLSKEEAAQLADSARDVFKARLVNLGVQFGLAVNEQRWRDALEVGLQIKDEFPNSRMAREVSQKVEALRVRAGMVADVTIGPEAES